MGHTLEKYTNEEFLELQEELDNEYLYFLSVDKYVCVGDIKLYDVFQNPDIYDSVLGQDPSNLFGIERDKEHIKNVRKNNISLRKVDTERLKLVKFLEVPFIDLPFYINSSDNVISAATRWRLKLGK